MSFSIQLLWRVITNFTLRLLKKHKKKNDFAWMNFVRVSRGLEGENNNKQCVDIVSIIIIFLWYRIVVLHCIGVQWRKNLILNRLHIYHDNWQYIVHFELETSPRYGKSKYPIPTTCRLHGTSTRLKMLCGAFISLW
jgi:hypothetical protein